MTTLSEIYQRHSIDIYRFALGLSGDPAWAEDIAAETFLRALVSPNPIRVETAKAYLFAIARNLYLQAWHKERHLIMLEESVPESRPGPEHLAERQGELRAVLAGLQTLSEVDRAALLMRAQDELSYEAIASALGLSLAAVKVRIHRARLKLAQIVKEAEA